MEQLRLIKILHGACLAVAVALAGCSVAPEKLFQQIESGDAAHALKTLEAKRPSTKPELREVLALLEAHARLQLCAARNCATTAGPGLPALLQPVAELLQAAPTPIELAAGETRLTSNSVVASATAAFAKLSNQPTALLALRTALPPARAQAQLEALALPALAAARGGNNAAAANILRALDTQAGLSEGYRFTAGWLAAQLISDSALLQSRSAGLYAQSGRPEAASAALLQVLPHALFAQLGSVEKTLASLTLNLQATPNSLGPLTLPMARHWVARELATLAKAPPTHWAQAWQTGQHGPLVLALQRVSLALEPNQPPVWQAYLNGLVAAVAANQNIPELASEMGLGNQTFAMAQAVVGPSRPQLGKALLEAATQMQNYPATAAPLLLLASQLQLPSNQQAALDKLAQSLLLKAATAKDITAILALAQARPQAAANNRQLVVPLLIEDIKSNLRSSNFTHAISTSSLIEKELGLPIELGPLVLEEFNADLKRRMVPAALEALTPDGLLQPQTEAAIDLGPIWGFMEDYFAARPEVLKGQLTTLIAATKGPWGPPHAMHRLLHAFPVAEQAGQRVWLNGAIVSAALEDTTLTPTMLVVLSGDLMDHHENLSVAPLLDAALNKTQTLEESRAVWAAATANLRPLLRQLRPQFAALMRGLDAYESHDYDTAAEAFAGLSEARWREQAAPALSGLYAMLAPLAGLYLPLSAAPEIPLGAVWVMPQGLEMAPVPENENGGLTQMHITLLNRLGTLAHTQPRSLMTTPAHRQRLSLTGPFSFNTRRFALTENVLSNAINGGTLNTVYGPIETLTFKPNPQGNTLLDAKLSNGSTVQLARILASPAQVLRPDGQYAILTALAQTLTPAVQGGEGILPPGSILTLQTAPTTQPASGEFGFEGEVYPLLGTLQHPAGRKPISFTGEYDATTLTSGFTFSYPLPSSGLPVKAGVLCQALAGALHCGAHHLHSPRVAYAALSRGQQTQESLAAAVANRTTENAIAVEELLARSKHKIFASTTAAASTTVENHLAPALPTEPAERVNTQEANPAVASATQVLSVTPVSPTSAPLTATEPAPGVFIYRGDGNVQIPSDTTPPPVASPR